MNGILLLNLGTPGDCDIRSVRRYLREFLNDPYVIDLPFFIRWPLVNLIILPTRPKRSAKAYQAIWTKAGSPLLMYSQRLKMALAKTLGPSFQVALGMRYGDPSIEKALLELKECSDILMLPLFPQYSSAATGSALDKAFHMVSKLGIQARIKTIKTFYQTEGFIRALSHLVKRHTQADDFILFSYHGLPERHIKKICSETHCDLKKGCPPMNNSNLNCYRAQCFETTRQVASVLNLNPERYQTTFQSRLGSTPWIQHYTDEMVPQLIQKGIQNLSIVSPAFTADCLETLEELGIQAKKQWLALGGKRFNLVPCLNHNPDWVNALGELIHRQLG